MSCRAGACSGPQAMGAALRGAVRPPLCVLRGGRDGDGGIFIEEIARSQERAAVTGGAQHGR
ncbi:hypothetical protein WME97_33040 [Sorangium sp. So ce367]|uniref:hypothetical protein n=1 Tax=Sorangium sp. So ce367 TaxID=3133305 RepID=UPI003F5F3136